MIDDDEEVGPQWLTVIADAFTDPHLDFIGGPYVPICDTPLPDWLPDEYLAVVGVVDNGSAPRPYGRDFPGILKGGNAVIRRRALQLVGPYAEHLGPGSFSRLFSCEDEDMHAPPVSVIVPCYNQARFLGAALDSVRAQDPYADVVVVDDGSTDHTRQVALSRPGVRYVRQDNRGLAGARNRGLRESAGSLVVFLDADDCLLPGGIAAGVTALATRPDCAMAYGRCVMMGPDGTPWPTPAQPVTICDHHDAFLRTNLIWMPAAAIFRREALEQAGGFHEGFDAAADYDLYLRITRDARIRDHGTLVAAYRQHPSAMSGKASRMANARRRGIGPARSPVS